MVEKEISISSSSEEYIPKQPRNSDDSPRSFDNDNRTRKGHGPDEHDPADDDSEDDSEDERRKQSAPKK